MKQYHEIMTTINYNPVANQTLFDVHLKKAAAKTDVTFLVNMHTSKQHVHKLSVKLWWGKHRQKTGKLTHSGKVG